MPAILTCARDCYRYRCVSRPLDGGWATWLQQLTRTWVLALHAEMSEDVWHSDGCERPRGQAGPDFFTVLSYPPADGLDGDWQEAWGGHIEFAARMCDNNAVGARRAATEASSEKAVMRLTPRADRVVVFSGQLLHRSTPPSRVAPLTETLTGLRLGVRPLQGRRAFIEVPAQARWRYTHVMQLLCENGAYGDAGGGHGGPDAPQWAGALACLLALVLVRPWLRSRKASTSAPPTPGAATATSSMPSADADPLLVLRLSAAPALLPAPSDERRMQALARFALDDPNRAPSGEAGSPDAQSFRVKCSDLLQYVRAGQEDLGAAMPPPLRFLRLYILLLVGEDDLITSFLETGRFKMRRKKAAERKAAFARLIEGNLAALGEINDSERRALEVVQQELPPPPSGVAMALERLRVAVFE